MSAMKVCEVWIGRNGAVERAHRVRELRNKDVYQIRLS